MPIVADTTLDDLIKKLPNHLKLRQELARPLTINLPEQEDPTGVEQLFADDDTESPAPEAIARNRLALPMALRLGLALEVSKERAHNINAANFFDATHRSAETQYYDALTACVDKSISTDSEKRAALARINFYLRLIYEDLSQQQPTDHPTSEHVNNALIDLTTTEQGRHFREDIVAVSYKLQAIYQQGGLDANGVYYPLGKVIATFAVAASGENTGDESSFEEGLLQSAPPKSLRGDIRDAFDKLPVSVQGMHADPKYPGGGYWCFRTPEQRKDDSNLEKSSTLSPAVKRFRFAVEAGMLGDNGLLSLMLAREFGEDVIAKLEEKAKRHSQHYLPYLVSKVTPSSLKVILSNHKMDKRLEAWEDFGIQCDLWTIQLIRLIQPLELLLNCQDEDKQKRVAHVTALITEERQALCTELEAYIETLDPNDKKRTLTDKLHTLVNEEFTVACLTAGVENLSHDQLLCKLQTTWYLRLLHKIREIQGEIARQENYSALENSGMRTLQRAQITLTNFNMAKGIPVSEQMLLRRPQGCMVTIADMQQPGRHMLAAHIADKLFPTDLPSPPLLFKQLQDSEWLKKIYQQCMGSISAVEAASRDQRVSTPKSALAYRQQHSTWLTSLRHGLLTGNLAEAWQDYFKALEHESYLTGFFEAESSERHDAIKALQWRLKNFAIATEPYEADSPASLIYREPKTVSLSPHQSDSLDGAMADFGRYFADTFYRLSVQRNIPFLLFFALPFIQFGISAAIAINSSKLLILIFKYVVVPLIKIEAAAIRTTLQVAVHPHHIKNFIELVNSYTTDKLYSPQGLLDVYVAAGFVPAKICFFSLDGLNAFTGPAGRSTWEELKRHYSHFYVGRQVWSKEIETKFKEWANFGFQLALATALGIGVHWIMTKGPFALQLLFEPVAAVCDLKPSDVVGNVLGDTSQLMKTCFSVYTVGLIFIKLHEIIHNVDHQHPNQSISALRRKLVAKFLQAADKDPALQPATKIVKAHLTNDGDIINPQALMRALKDARIEIADLSLTSQQKGQINTLVAKGNYSKANQLVNQWFPLQMLLLGLDQTETFARGLAHSPEVLVKLEQLKSYVQQGQLRNRWRQVVRLDDIDHQTLITFVALCGRDVAASQLVNGNEQQRHEFLRTKAHFEELMAQPHNQWLWQALFNDSRSRQRLVQLEVKRVPVSRARRIYDFTINDVLIRYGIGTVASPVVALMLVTGIVDKSRVWWPFRQFFATTLLPAVIRMFTRWALFLPAVLRWSVMSILPRFGLPAVLAKSPMLKAYLQSETIAIATVSAFWLNFVIGMKKLFAALFEPLFRIAIHLPELLLYTPRAVTKLLLMVGPWLTGVIYSVCCVVPQSLFEGVSAFWRCATLDGTLRLRQAYKPWQDISQRLMIWAVNGILDTIKSMAQSVCSTLMVATPASLDDAAQTSSVVPRILAGVFIVAPTMVVLASLALAAYLSCFAFGVAAAFPLVTAYTLLDPNRWHARFREIVAPCDRGTDYLLTSVNKICVQPVTPLRGIAAFIETAVEWYRLQCRYPLLAGCDYLEAVFNEATRAGQRKVQAWFAASSGHGSPTQPLAVDDLEEVKDISSDSGASDAPTVAVPHDEDGFEEWGDELPLSSARTGLLSLLFTSSKTASTEPGSHLGACNSSPS